MTDQQANGEPELNAAAIVAALNRNQVRYVIIGAFASIHAPRREWMTGNALTSEPFSSRKARAVGEAAVAI